MARGMTVRMPGARKVPNDGAVKDFALGGDLFVEQRVEVRHLPRTFTCQADWPFGEKFIICAKTAWEQAQPKPYAVLIVNEAMTHGAIVKAASRAFWTVERLKDDASGTEQDYFLCPMERVEFLPLVKTVPAG